MKFTLTVPVLAALLTTGCTTFLSTTPFAGEDQAIVETALTGTWTADDDTLLIRSNGRAYDITYLSEGKTAMKFTATLFRSGDAKLMDLVPVNDDPFVMPLHAVARVWPEGNTLRWAFLDSDWLKERAARAVPTQRDRDRTILMAPGAALIREFGADEKAHNKPSVWTRLQ